MDIVQGGNVSGTGGGSGLDTSTGTGTVALSTTGGALGGYDAGNATLRVEPVAATFPTAPTEVVSLRDAHRRVVANPNGTLTETTSSGRLNYKDAAGTWKQVDTSLASSQATPGFNLAERANNGSIVFNTTSASEPVAALLGPGFSLSFRVPGLSGSGKQNGTNGLEYAGTGGDSSIVLNSTSDGFEFGAVLSRSTAPNTYSFAVGTNGLSLVVAADGQTVQVVSGQGADQQVLGVIGAPSLLDAHGAVAPAGATKVSLDAKASGLRDGETLLIYALDRTWLAASARAYPVTLDPTACIRWDATSNCSINANAKGNGSNPGYVDTYVSAASPDQVGSGTYEHIGVDATLGTTRSLYFFPHAALPDGAQIVSANLKVYLAAGTASGQLVRASAITTPWSGSSATWNTKPSTDVAAYVDTPTVASGWLNMDVSEIVRARYTRNAADWQPDYGFELQTAVEDTSCASSTCGHLMFKSASMATDEPQLTLTYVVPHVKINFDPALGPDYAPSKMSAGGTTNVPVQINNNGSGFTFNRCGDPNDCYKIGYRWYDSAGRNLNITGFTPSGTVDLPGDVPNQSWTSVFNLPIVTPPAPGQFGLRLDLVHVVSGHNVWASDWAFPSLYLSRAKDNLNSTNVHMTGQSVIPRNDFSVALSSGAMAGGFPKSVALPDGSTAAIDLWSGNLTVSASSGVGFSDLGGSVDLSYYYDSAQAPDATACDLILGACGWGTNFDERIENASSGANYTYRDPAGNRYFVGTNANGQLVSDAPVKVDRPRITVLDENVVPGWTTTGSGLPAVSATYASSGSHSYSFASTNTAGATTTAINADINQYPTLSFSVRSSAGGMGVGFHVRDNTTGAQRWLVYTLGADFTLPDANMTRVPLGGDTSAWLAAGGSNTPSGLNIWSQVVGDSSFGGPNDDYSVVGLGMFGNGAAGTDYLDALRFEPRATVLFDDPSVTMPAWTWGGSKASSASASGDKFVGASALKVLQADASDEPKCLCLNAPLASVPYATWYWRKVGGSSIAETFYLHDTRSSATGSITYYAGPSVPTGVQPQYAIQVSKTAPNDWTRVTRDLEDDARQLLGYYNQDTGGTYSAAGGSPTPDPVILDGYALLAVDGSYAGFDWESLITQPSLDFTTGDPSADDFVVTMPGGATHRFNQDGLLTSLRDLDGNLTTLEWTYDFASTTGGSKAYKLVAIHAPSEHQGMTTASGGAAVRRIEVTYGTGTVRFAEKLGTASASSGRVAEFDIDASGNLTNVIPARHVGACAAAGAASGCTGYAYDANRYLTRIYDPRYDGSASNYTDIGYVPGTPTTPTRAVSITPVATHSPLLRVLSSNTTPTGLYLRPEWQDANAVASNFAYYADITANGGVYTAFRAIPCASPNCAGATTIPAIPVDMLAAYRTDGLNNPTQETRYRLPGNQAPVISRRGTQATAKIDNYPDPLAATKVTWTQSPDQYLASVNLGNGDLFKTSVNYNDLGLQTSTTTPVSNPAFGPTAPWSKQTVSRTSEQIYDLKGHLIQSDDNTFLANTDFENSLTGWTAPGATADTSVARSGVASLGLSGAATASQRAQLLPGQTFRLQAALKNDGGTPAVGLRYERTDGTWVAIALQVPSVGSSWTMLSNDVTVPLDGTGQVELSFSVAGGSGTAHVDDVALMTAFSGSTYNTLGQLIASTDISGRVTSIAYSPDTSPLPAGMPAPGQTPAIFPTRTIANYIDGVFDAAHPDQDVASHATYDVWGRAVRKIDADGVAAWTLYAANMTDITSSTDGLGNTTSLTYDEVGNKLTVTPPGGASERTVTTYDFFDKPIETTAPDGTRTHYTYDGASRLKAKYANYATGNPVAGTLTDVATTYAYDAYGHVTSTVGDQGQGTANISTESSYDLLGNVVTTTSHAVAGDAGRTTTNIFDAAGRAAGVQNAIAPTASPAPPSPHSWMDVWEQMPVFGTPVNINIAIPGQKGSVTFNGTIGQRISIVLYGPAYSDITLQNPDGTTLFPNVNTGCWGNYYTDLLILPQTGTYTLRMSPEGWAPTGQYTVTVWSVPADVALSTSTRGSPIELLITTPGQRGSIAFNGTAGERISIQLSGPTYSDITLKNPDGTTLVPNANTGCWGNYYTDLLVLPQTGTYTLGISPEWWALTGLYNVTIWSVPADVVLSTAPSGLPVAVVITTPSQRGSVTFNGTAGERISIQLSGPTYSDITLKNPDGTTLFPDANTGCWGNYYIDLLVLTQTGTYTLGISPETWALTGQYTVTVSDLGLALNGSALPASVSEAAHVRPRVLAAIADRVTSSTDANVALTDELPPTKTATPATTDGTTGYCNSVVEFDLNGQAIVSVAMRKSPLVAVEKSPLVAM